MRIGGERGHVVGRNRGRTEGSDDERDSLRETAEDIVGVLDRHGNEQSAERVAGHDGPHHRSEAMKNTMCAEQRIVGEVHRAQRDRGGPHAELDVT